MTAPASVPGWPDDPSDPLRGLDSRALLDNMAALVAAVFWPDDREGAPRDLLARAEWIADCPPDSPFADELRRDFAFFLANLRRGERRALLRQATALVAARDALRKAARSRRRAKP